MLGSCRSPPKTEEGEDLALRFHDFDVSMPILSVAKLAEENLDVTFSKKGGTMPNLSTNLSSRFVKRAGVYFMKIMVPKKISQSSDRFGRLSAP